MPSVARHARLSAAFPGDVDAVLISGAANIRWVSGFSGSISAALVSADPQRSVTLAVDGRYLNRARAEAPACELLPTRSYAPDLIRRARELGCRRVGIESAHVSLAQFADWELAATDVGLELVGCAPMVEPLRAVKDDAEITALRTACRVTDDAFGMLLPQLRPGLTEREIEWLLIALFRDCGGDGPAFDAIVAAAENGATPHHSPTDRPLQDGDLLTLDFGAAYDGMHADMTRTVAIGRVADWQRDLHSLIQGIAESLRVDVAPGVDPAELNTRAASAITAAGYAVAHGLGHGVGLEIHEEPWLTSTSTSPSLIMGTTLTIEPGAYPDGRNGGPIGGVRIEDTMLVTEAGAEALTGSPRNLIELT